MNYIIRPIELADAAGMVALRKLHGVIETTMALPSEPVSRFSERWATYDPTNHGFVAITDDNQLIAWSALFEESSHRHRHVGSLGLIVHPNFQGQGIGGVMLEKVLDIADNWLMLHRVELTVVAGNKPAIHLYEKNGFKIEGCKVDALISNGAYVDELIMGRLKNNI